LRADAGTLLRPTTRSFAATPTQQVTVFMFQFFKGYFSSDLAIDRYRQHTICVRGKGIVLNEPSVVAIRQEGGPNGKRVSRRSGSRPSRCWAERPAISRRSGRGKRRHRRLTVTEQMLKQFIKKALDCGSSRPAADHHLRACGSTQVERRAITNRHSARAHRRCTWIGADGAAIADLPISTPPARWWSISVAAPKSA
jgi:rod shape-determining protein MreB